MLPCNLYCQTKRTKPKKTKRTKPKKTKRMVSSHAGVRFQALKGTVSPPERCDFTSLQQYNNNVL